MIGFPSVGKSTLLGSVTDTESCAAAYEFTTLTCIPGVIHYNDAKIQLLDLPGIIEGAAKGKGRGKQVIAVARTADCVLMVLDALKADNQKEKLTAELAQVGIRLNCEPPKIYYKQKKGGGIAFNTTVPNTHGLDAKSVYRILHEYKIHNAEVLLREDSTVDEFVDVVIGNRLYRVVFMVKFGHGRVEKEVHLWPFQGPFKNQKYSVLRVLLTVLFFGFTKISQKQSTIKTRYL